MTITRYDMRMLTIEVNGEPASIEPPCTVADLLRQRGLAETACAVEVNRELVPKREHADRTITEGDRIEIVTLVGGG